MNWPGSIVLALLVFWLPTQTTHAWTLPDINVTAYAGKPVGNDANGLAYSSQIVCGLNDTYDYFPGKYFQLQAQLIHAKTYATSTYNEHGMTGFLAGIVIDANGAVPRREYAIMPIVMGGAITLSRTSTDPERLKSPYYFGPSEAKVEDTIGVLFAGAHLYSATDDLVEVQLDAMIGTVDDLAFLFNLMIDVSLYRGLALSVAGQTSIIYHQAPTYAATTSPGTHGSVLDAGGGYAWTFVFAGLTYQF